MSHVAVPPVVALLGPTASGKSSLAVGLAELLADEGIPAEIVNADSMLVYRGMDIGTAKPGPDELARVPHHLVDVLDITTTSSVALVQTMARHAIEDCRERDVLPLVVGGSALYSRAVLDELDIPPTDPAVRARLEADLEELGSRALHDRLAERDPRAAASILPGNGRRIVRALEVVELTGSFSATMPQGRFHIPGTVEIGLNLSRDDLDRRIAERVDRMWRDGLVDEVRRLAGRGLRQGRTASRALGYRQVLQYLDGMIDEDRARLDTVVRTRRFARKQLMWYRRDPRIRWFDALSPRLVEQVAEGMRLT
ncbi:MAG: tRNA (adenosine(37)-N6)-dimethylallyltransferase MiaA [Acidipropionibacterium acidipropionici]|jgi:tRNA dimethylallyltransferase|uniref:tRNA dimethylallyltransferase n=2 Tax=Acidipropionibacterium acidipropionici TaxID=1748 RepID=K7S4A7_ACIA4|nr:tRNA (adenosine(37)-N6)-dimethylallyltransferase MiaA [Acidipropionibacterium acidipropionici]AFV89407.1 tRNA dimethylallyltransferase [Acidipropionibacterium acidipropionici ATCC 4875]APZ08136.1 tRNA dimethylallyltransferase [Acidipropionibacterium acidipropionici]AZP37865.1 tRNA (adenosine(37)-N6)-dimethylallyltransferase MiaA [Acidipropionibacterium acidipropionici]MDN6556787.1 tRNA (adenosine(37)-N6)-dimethylallyltransferase MiaA [Acidipropionibacterium acidipropionici]QCV95150.1 tRNA (